MPIHPSDSAPATVKSDDCAQDCNVMPKFLPISTRFFISINFSISDAFITFKETYEGCGHTKVDFVEVPEDFVNLSKEELKDKYSDWNIEKFTDTDIILSKDFEGSCDEHFIVKDVNGVVTVFKIKEDGTEEEYQTTDIATEYLTDTDKLEMEKGISVNGKQNLNQLIEDYE